MIKNIFLTLTLLLSAFAVSAQNPSDWRAKLSPEVRSAFDRNQTADVLVVFFEQADLSGARQLHGKNARSRFVFNRLQQTAERSQANARRMLRQRGARSNSYYLVNAISIEQADGETLRLLADLPEVKSIALDPWVQMPPPFVEDNVVNQRNTVEWGVEKINAPAVWAMGYTGQGITVGGADTGYEWGHPVIQSHYRGWNANGPADHNYNWHDAIHDLSPLNGDTTNNPLNNPCGLNSGQPCDDNNHGTHTMGTMVGDDGAGNQTGVAPGAKWVGCRNMERGWGKPSSYIECFEWFLAPTDINGQNPDPSKSPDVINNSWYCADIEGCTDLTINELLHTAVINLKAAGVVVVVSNGNNGGICSTTDGPPAYFEESFSVGATRSNDTIAGFSSRGPVIIDGSLRNKPNVSAPGVSVRSSVRGGGYANFSGTSMAGPHVVGLVALMFSANPELRGEVELVEDIIEQTSVFLADTLDCGTNSLGASRPNHAYGWGRVDALAAVNVALSVDTGQPLSQSAQVTVSPNPTSDEVTFFLENFEGKTTINLYSVNGQRLLSTSFVPKKRELYPLSLRQLPAGIYLYEISAENGTTSGKIMKQ
ncbi:MAG: S8 family peptidase [Saprospiraceae bacterium]